MPDLAQRRADVPALAGARRIDDRVLVVCGLAWAAGLIHVQAAITHLDGHPVQAVLFELLACAQLVWGVVVYRWPTRRWLTAGAVASVGVAAVWALSRTVGLPIGSGAWTPEAVGALDVIATADELLVAIVAVSLRAGRRPARAPVIAAGVLLVVLSSIVLVTGSHAH